MSSIGKCCGYVFACCRISLYMCYRKLCCVKPVPPRAEYSVVCVGFTGAGKTTILTELCGENTDNVAPTQGFNIKAVPFGECILNVKELGGNEKIRQYWERYYEGSQGLIFVINSASPEEELQEVSKEFFKALSFTLKDNLPILVLATFQDHKDARSREQLTEALDLEKQAEGREWILHLCSINNIEQTKEGFKSFNSLLKEQAAEEERKNKGDRLI